MSPSRHESKGATATHNAAARMLRLIASMPEYRHWTNPQITPEIRAVLDRLDHQQLLSLAAEALSRALDDDQAAA